MSGNRKQACDIWQAGVAAVDSQHLVEQQLSLEDHTLRVGNSQVELTAGSRVLVVGAGKAGAGMANGVESIAANLPASVELAGWVNVPADCVRVLPHIHLHAARPAGVNEPTAEGVAGTREILRRLGELTAADVCLVLLSGGGSALLPAPKPGITLTDKLAVTRLLAAAGASIQELNCVRTQLSLVKGGGLLRAMSAGADLTGRVFTLVISDVIGDPLDIIASGPTFPATTTAADALSILQKYVAHNAIPPAVLQLLQDQASSASAQDKTPAVQSEHQIIGTNEVALTAAATTARESGYRVVSLGSRNAGIAAEEGRDLLARCRKIQQEMTAGDLPVCVLSGGEPTVKLVDTDQPRKGGRNQELVLSAVASAWDAGLEGITILSGGTDGEDGPTDAAGAVADADTLQVARSSGTSPHPHLAINDAYTFFDQVGGLIRIGPTHTNVMDLRVALVHPCEEA